MPARAPVVLITCILLFVSNSVFAELRVGFGEADITPDLKGEKAVYLAGYGQNRRATGVHDPLMARAVVLASERQKIALVACDVIGVMYPTALAIRAKLDGYLYVMVSATHNHEGPDTIGLWGGSPVQSGVDPAYTKRLIERCVEAVRAAEKNLAPVRAHYGTAEDESLLGDSRLPKVYDGVLRTLQFTRISDNKAHGLLIQWNCHPESMGSKNTQITADFPWSTVAALKKKHHCPVAYFSGAVGGLMAPPDGVAKTAEGVVLKEGDFEYARVYGELVAGLADKAIEKGEAIELTPFYVVSKKVYLPLTNPLYVAARKLGVLDREAFVWKESARHKGEPYTDADVQKQPALETEVAYVALGELHMACIPGEIYPELIYGKIQDPPDAGADFPDAPKETHITSILPGKKILTIGLANDEMGYIIPKRQWDAHAPYAYGRKRTQYGEMNSIGPDAAPLLMKALEECVNQR
jgi:hypothetical protein